MQLMVEQERRYVDQIRQDLASSNSTKLQLELDSAVKRLAKLEQQLDDLKAGKVRLDIGISVGVVFDDFSSFSDDRNELGMTSITQNW